MCVRVVYLKLCQLSAPITPLKSMGEGRSEMGDSQILYTSSLFLFFRNSRLRKLRVNRPNDNFCMFWFLMPSNKFSKLTTLHNLSSSFHFYAKLLMSLFFFYFIYLFLFIWIIILIVNFVAEILYDFHVPAV